MNSSRKVRGLVPAIAVALLAVALLVPAAKAAETPPLISTSQYKALVSFVEKLDQIRTPATSAQKANYEDQLQNKHDAAADKATALLDRGKKAAQRESQREISIGVQTIRQTQAGELAALRKDYDARMDRAATNFENSVGRVESTFDDRSAALRRQVSRLRKQKANANTGIAKVAIQGAIDRRTKRGSENRKLQQEEVADLKADYAAKRPRSAKASSRRPEPSAERRGSDRDPARPRQADLQRHRPHAAGSAGQPAERSRTEAQAGQAAITRIPAKA